MRVLFLHLLYVLTKHIICCFILDTAVHYFEKEKVTMRHQNLTKGEHVKIPNDTYCRYPSNITIWYQHGNGVRTKRGRLVEYEGTFWQEYREQVIEEECPDDSND